MALARRVGRAVERREYSMLRPGTATERFFGPVGAGGQEHPPPVLVRAPRGGPVCRSWSRTGLLDVTPAHKCCNTSRAPLPCFPISLRRRRRPLSKQRTLHSLPGV